ncbi:hypothetical protein K438DRAFT_1940916 [Mycena galopus ATCC 62051]|nr:hypothetical protein K438DRAFT_1940916 [Mycena galopus ATCC 62051]
MKDGGRNKEIGRRRNSGWSHVKESCYGSVAASSSYFALYINERQNSLASTPSRRQTLRSIVRWGLLTTFAPVWNISAGLSFSSPPSVENLVAAGIGLNAYAGHMEIVKILARVRSPSIDIGVPPSASDYSGSALLRLPRNLPVADIGGGRR